MKKKKFLITVLMLFILIGVTSCAPKGYERSESGFFSGLLHGFVLIFALLGKLFGFSVGIYAAHNNGFFYWLGFIIGIGGIGGGASASRR